MASLLDKLTAFRDELGEMNGSTPIELVCQYYEASYRIQTLGALKLFQLTIPKEPASRRLAEHYATAEIPLAKVMNKDGLHVRPEERERFESFVDGYYSVLRDAADKAQKSGDIKVYAEAVSRMVREVVSEWTKYRDSGIKLELTKKAAA